MKHNITIHLQQITDIEAIWNDLVTRGDKAYGDASKHVVSSGGAAATAAKQKNEAKRLIWLKKSAALEAKADKLNAEGDRLMAQAELLHSIISQIKKNG
jgi:hypothetical protein